MRHAGSWRLTSTKPPGRKMPGPSWRLAAVRRAGRAGEIALGQRWPYLDILFRACPGSLARKMGAFLLTQTMERRPEIGLDSYDRFFPSQDTLPNRGLWQLDCLATAKETARAMATASSWMRTLSRIRINGPFFHPLRRMSRQEVESVVERGGKAGRILGSPPSRNR